MKKLIELSSILLIGFMIGSGNLSRQNDCLYFCQINRYQMQLLMQNNCVVVWSNLNWIQMWQVSSSNVEVIVSSDR